MRKRHILIVILILFLLAWTHRLILAREGDISDAEEGEGYNIDFAEVELSDLVKTISDMTGENFILDEQVRGRITIIAPKKVSKEEAFRVFESVLEVKGFTIVRSGKVIKIVRSADARQTAIETHVKPRIIPPKDTFITQLIPLTFVAAEDMSSLLKDFVSKNGRLIPYPPTNILIFIDTASNIGRLLRIIKSLDIAGFEEQIEIIPLKNAMAQTMVSSLNEIFEVGKAPKKQKVRRKAESVPSGPGVSKIIADDRTNSLIVIATRDMMEKVKEIIARLDAPIEVGEGKIHVRYMENARAEELAQVLNSLISGLTGSKRSKKGPGEVPPLQLEGAVKITSDKATNSLIIIASRSDFKTIEMVIELLDKPRKQVYVEGVIMEISLDKTRELGLVLHGAAAVGEEGAAFGGTSLGGVNTLGMTADAMSLGAIVSKGGLFTGILGKPITVNIGGASISVPGFGALLNLLAGDEDVNILSTPQLLAMDNEEAEIIVGSNVPFITGQSVTTGGTTMQTIERQDVGIKLKITPQINEKGFVRLAIFQEISQVSEQLPTGFDVSTAGLITRKRSAKTTVVIKNEQTVVLGGLLEDNLNISERKVPLLGDIPIIGWLFRSSRKRKIKTNLLIFLTPYVISTSEDLDEITIRKSLERMEFQDKEHLDREMRQKVKFKEGKEDKEKVEKKIEAKDEVIEIEEEPEINLKEDSHKEEVEKKVGASDEVMEKGPSEPTEDVPIKLRGRVTAGRLNVRNNPDKSAKIIFVLHKGEEVDIIDKSDFGFLIIREDGLVGWASSKYITLIEH